MQSRIIQATDDPWMVAFPGWAATAALSPLPLHINKYMATSTHGTLYNGNGVAQ